MLIDAAFSSPETVKIPITAIGSFPHSDFHHARFVLATNTNTVAKLVDLIPYRAICWESFDSEYPLVSFAPHFETFSTATAIDELTVIQVVFNAGLFSAP